MNCTKLHDLPESFYTLPNLRSAYLHGSGLRSPALAKLRAAFPECDFHQFFR